MKFSKKHIGYWEGPSPSDRDYPKVEAAIDRDWDKIERQAVVKYLKTGKEFGAYHGMSPCRCCGQPNGSREFTDGTFIWPEGYSHYIQQHGVKPPGDFVTHVRKALGMEPIVVPDDPRDVHGFLNALRPEIDYQDRLRELYRGTVYQLAVKAAHRLLKQGRLSVENLRTCWRDPMQPVAIPGLEHTQKFRTAAYSQRGDPGAVVRESRDVPIKPMDISAQTME